MYNRFGESMIDRLHHRLVFEIDNIIYYFLIFSNLIYPLIFVLFVIYLLKSNKIKINNYVWIPVKISIIYLSLLIITFLISESNLIDFLKFGVRRVTMPIIMMLYIFSFMVLKEMKIYDNLIKYSRKK